MPASAFIYFFEGGQTSLEDLLSTAARPPDRPTHCGHSPPHPVRSDVPPPHDDPASRPRNPRLAREGLDATFSSPASPLPSDNLGASVILGEPGLFNSKARCGRLLSADGRVRHPCCAYVNITPQSAPPGLAFGCLSVLRSFPPSI